MAFRFNKGIKIGKGLGVNLSKSGITPSYRTKRGSLSSKGYSLRTSILSLSYRKTFSKTKNSGCIIALLPFAFIAVLLSCSGSEDSTPCRDTNCANYTSQTAAQSAFDADPECR